MFTNDDDDDDDEHDEDMMKHKNLDYNKTVLNIYFITKGELNNTNKQLFNMNMVDDKIKTSSKSSLFLLKNTKMDKYAISNAGYDMNDNTIFSNEYQFEDLMEYMNEENLSITPEKMQENIRQNIDFYLKMFFPYKGEIKIGGKTYIIAKSELLYEKGVVHIGEDNYYDIGFKNSNITFEKTTLDKLKKEGRYGHKKYDTKNNKRKERKDPDLNSINVTVDLTLLDKSKNPSFYNFAQLTCDKKRGDMRRTYDSLIFNLFGVRLKKADGDDILKQRKRDIKGIKRFNYKYTKNKEEEERLKKEKELKEKRRVNEELLNILEMREMKRREEEEKKDKEKEKEKAKQDKEKMKGGRRTLKKGHSRAATATKNKKSRKRMHY
jgi:hypothetical protein